MRRNPVTFVFSSPEEAVEFLETLERIAGPHISGELRMNKVKIYIHSEGKMYKEILRKIQALYTSSHNISSHASRKYNIMTLLSIADIKTPIPPVILEELLRLKGYRASLTKSGVLETNADPETIKKLIRELSEAYSVLLHIPSTTQAKRVIALLSVYWGKDVNETISTLKDMGLLEEGERLTPRHNFRKIIDIAVRSSE